jgi:hypothetical protein
MGIVFGIGKSMVNPVHDGIHTRTHIRRTLGKIGYQEKKSFPAPVHGKSPVGCITVMKEGLGKQRQIPMRHKKNKDRYHNAE